MDNKEFGLFLRELRKKRGLTVRKLAELSNVSRSYIANIENGRRSIPSADILSKLAEPLGIDFLTLMEKAGYHEIKVASDLNDLIEWDLTTKLFNDKTHLNGHALTAEERQRILDMLYLMFPEKRWCTYIEGGFKGPVRYRVSVNEPSKEEIGQEEE